MTALIEARGLTRKFGHRLALDQVSFTVQPGRIVGLIGPNGAGKTTALRALLGLTSYTGALQVLGHEPFRERAALLQDVTYIADVAVLPGWLRVDQAIDYVAGVHPRFRRERALALLAKSGIERTSRVRELSKGTQAQVHLALTMAIDARLLVLDEPTLGLDLLARRQFYDTLVGDYLDGTRTILVTTHQVEEIELLLTDVLILHRGRMVLEAAVDELPARYAALAVNPDRLEEARALRPFYERPIPGRCILYFSDPDRERLAPLGELSTPSVSDLCVALLSGPSA